MNSTLIELARSIADLHGISVTDALEIINCVLIIAQDAD